MRYTITNIIWDTSEPFASSLENEMVIDVPDNITEPDEIEEYISDEISDRSGFCHKGFATTPEIKY